MHQYMHRLSNKTITFNDYPEFRPNLTPKEIFAQGAFGGTYWRPIHSGVTKKNYKNRHLKYNWKLSNELLTKSIPDKSKNKYKVMSGTSLKYWESKHWIKAQDPYGWVQWYCEFYKGRRSPDDERQIKRWLAFAGPKGRFLTRIVHMIKKAKTSASDKTISPVIRQGLHQWAKTVTSDDL